jgi:hypothetical protein
MSRPNPTLFALYRHALRLYPYRLRLLYQAQMLQSIRDAHTDAERNSSAISFWLRLFTDLLKSSLKEHILMSRDEVMRRPIFFHALTLCVLLTLMGGGAAITMQQMLRRDADHPQIEMAGRYAYDIAHYHIPPALVLPTGFADPSTSLEPFYILYDGAGKRLRSNGYLKDAVLPDPPPGVFAYLRRHPTDTFTWQPGPGLRIAAFAQRIDVDPGFDLNPNPGFILVGRSLTMVQRQEDQLRTGTFITWFFLMALLIAGALFLNRAQFRIQSDKSRAR